MLQISPDIFLEILGMRAVPLAFQTEQFPDRAALASCGLVCKSWSALSQRLLFQRGRTMDGHIFYARTITAETDKSRWLRESVFSIVLRPHQSTKTSHIVDLLTHLPNLPELVLLAWRVTLAKQSWLSFRAQVAVSDPCPCVSIQITLAITSMATPVWPAVTKLISAIPTIRILSVTNNTVQ
ncbi:hypothetical protein C8F04DRAFT_1249626 [Mycena alexandri]|uniref:F-box domain-containing protein n=1 Tax=Mycena alexandri TaxID=1745969 RepID=A0AAD6TJV7_9AGAR|nr:hypothetical protein C8F04DRAFT_1249626 [Mycena alexandri]